MDSPAVHQALALLGLHVPFTQNQLRKQFHRHALSCHPDKGGDNREMQRLVGARDLLQEFAEVLEKTPEVPLEPPTPAPSDTIINEAIAHGSEFLRALRETPKRSYHRSSAMQLWRCIHDAARSPIMGELLLFGAQCVAMLADNLPGDPSTQTWTSCGYKYLSYQGYDTDCNGLRIIDYGNFEYYALIQCWTLAQPAMHGSLNRLRSAWPTYLDVWRSPATGRHIERLADVVEIILAAARAEGWFKPLWDREQYQNGRKLPALFSQLTTLCKIIQCLTARLATRYLKHKREVVPLFSHLRSLEFSRRWANDYAARGLLLFGLLVSEMSADVQ